MLHNRNY